MCCLVLPCVASSSSKQATTTLRLNSQDTFALWRLFMFRTVCIKTSSLHTQFRLRWVDIEILVTKCHRKTIKHIIHFPFKSTRWAIGMDGEFLEYEGFSQITWILINRVISPLTTHLIAYLIFTWHRWSNYNSHELVQLPEKVNGIW